MAHKRMFSLSIVDTDAFMDMPPTSQLLYFHLSMRADDDGFVDNSRKIMRSIGSTQDDLKILIAKRFVIVFESGILVIKHWRINNYLRTDRYQETKYLEEKKSLKIKENGSYTELGIPNDNQTDTIGKPRREEKSIEKKSIEEREAKASTLSLEDMMLPYREKYPDTMLLAFFSYWTEHDQRGNERWRSEKYFEVGRRLATWAGREKNSFNSKQKFSSI